MATTHPCVCTCTCAWPRAASGTCSQQPGKPCPTGIRWGRGHRAVSTQRTTPSYVVGSSGKIWAVVVWKEVFQSWSLRGTYCRRCGQSRAYLGKGILPYKHPRKKRELCSRAAPKTMVCHSVCPAHPTAPQTPGATATVNQAAGQWAAGPG